MATLTVPGLLPGIKCPSCKKGYLIVVITVDEGRSGPRGPGANVWRREVIERLACSKCSISYETKLRHQTLYQVFQAQLSKKRFEEGGEKVKRCKDHPRLILVEKHHEPDHRTGLMFQRDEGRNIKYCPACLKVCTWAER